MKRKPAEPNRAPCVWTVAGSDSGGGAGVQADLRAFADFGTHGCTVLTAVTAQSAGRTLDAFPLSAAQVRAQFQAIARDFPPRAIKIGMTGGAEVLQPLLEALENAGAFSVWDPALRASDGSALFAGDARAFFRALAPRVDLLTPNIPEAEELSGVKIDAPEDVENAAQALLEKGARATLIKGGHRRWDAEFVWDYWRNREGDSFWLRARRLPGAELRGSGCILSAALAASVARGDLREDAPAVARAYLQRVMSRASIAGGRRIAASSGLPGKAAELPDLFPAFQASPPPAVAPWEGEPPGLYPVVPSAEWVRRLTSAGVRTVQLRVKEAAPAEIDAEVRAAADCARENGARLFVNDHWRAAIACGAWGTHLGQEDLAQADLGAVAAAGLRLGISAHCWREIARARALRPSYIALGPVFPTLSKEMKFAPIGLEKLRLWNRMLAEERPCAAIGGIDLDNAAEVLNAGVAGIAMIRAICAAEDWRRAVAGFQRLLKRPVSADDRAAAGPENNRRG